MLLVPFVVSCCFARLSCFCLICQLFVVVVAVLFVVVLVAVLLLLVLPVVFG